VAARLLQNCSYDRVGSFGGRTCRGKVPYYILRQSGERLPESRFFVSPPLAPGVYFWLYPVFEAVRYGEIQRDTSRYS